MRLASAAAIVFLVTPAFAQQATAPPLEGFYRDIPDAYDLLLRPQQQATETEIVSQCRLRIEGPLTPEKRQEANSEIVACAMDWPLAQPERNDPRLPPENDITPLRAGAPCIFPTGAKARLDFKAGFAAYETCMLDWIKRHHPAQAPPRGS